VRSRWSSEAAAGLDALALRVYTSRLLGAEPSLVLYGGGNTSVKHTAPHPRGGSRRTLTIKGSGTDLATIQAGGFASLALDDLVPLRKRETLDDDAMVELVTLALLDSRAPRPSIETLLHAFIPLDWVDHSHADAILTLTNQPDGVARVRDVLRTRLAWSHTSSRASISRGWPPTCTTASPRSKASFSTSKAS